MSFKTDNPKRVSFKIEINKEVYTSSLWGDPPQFALWLLSKDTNEIINVFATHRTAKNDWLGKASCPVSLPIWDYYNKNRDALKERKITGTVKIDAISGASIKIKDVVKNMFSSDNKYQLDIDGVSGATPKKTIETHVEMFDNDIYEVYFEINCSGDFNEYYQSKNLDMGEEDYYGNGQPSIIYKGLIDLSKMTVEHPKLFGRSDQYIGVNKVNVAVDSITTAKNLLDDIIIEIKRR